MKFELKRTSSETYFNYIKQILKDYDEESNVKIYDYLCSAINEEMKNAVNKIMDSVNMMEFYFIAKSLEKDKVKKDVEESIKEYREKVQNFIFDDIYSSKAIKNYLFFLELWQKSEFISDIMNYIYKHGKLSETANIFIRKTLIDSIIYTGHFLNHIGIMEQLLTTANYNNLKNHISKFSFTLGETKEVSSLEIYEKNLKYSDIKEPKTVMEIFTYDYLHLLNFSKLIFINLFWVNKMAKSYENILAFLILLFGNDNVLYGIKDGTIDFETFKSVMEPLAKINYDKVLKFLRDLYEDDLLSSNMRVLLPIYETLAVTYAHKNFCIFSALENEDVKEIKNFGVVEDTMINSMIVYMWDLPKFNLPISVHLSKNSFVYYLENIRKENRVRAYMCNDFFGSSILDNMPNALLFPVPKGDAEYLTSKARINNRLAHITFLQNGKWPEHFKNDKGKIEKRYVSLEDLKK